MKRHLLVTNDYPPKVGGIQNYLWELWRRLPPQDFDVYTTPHRGASEFDAEQAYRIDRSAEPVLLPNPVLSRRIRRLSRERNAALVVLDPAVPLGLIGPHLDLPYAVVLHGAEVTIPGRLPGSRQALGRVLRGASAVIAAGQYSADEAERAAGKALPITVIPPGVDTERYRPLPPPLVRAARTAAGLPADGQLVLSVSRLVPRKGMDTLIEAAHRLAERHPDLVVAIVGSGRDARRLERLAAEGPADVRLLGRLPEQVKIDLYAAADVFAMMCRTRWGGLEQEGFGIVFLEAAAAGTPQVAGRSGGAAEAVADGQTGLVVEPTVEATAAAVEALLVDEARRVRMSEAGRARVVESFEYDVLARQLEAAIDAAC